MTVELTRRRSLAPAGESNIRFVASLIPGLELTRILRHRNPALRALAKKLCETEPGVVEALLVKPPYKLYDEDTLHAFPFGPETKPDLTFVKTRRFPPHVKNWVVCDALFPKGLIEDLGRLEAEAKHWLISEHTYTRHFGTYMHIMHLLGETSHPELLVPIGSLDSEGYYIYMTQGWYFVTVLAK